MGDRLREAIVLVEDEPVVLMALRLELEARYGDRFIFEGARSAEEAESRIEGLVRGGVSVPLVISDWMMPGMKGDELIDRLHDRHPEIRAILLSGYARSDCVDRLCSECGLSAFISKPWSQAELFSSIDEAVDLGK